MFTDEQALIEHKMHTMEAADRLFRDFALTTGRPCTARLRELSQLVKERMGTTPAVFVPAGTDRSATVSQRRSESTRARRQ
jgi:hypothetical protein